ncbi:YkvA family protein [Syntrophomonas palmitatica]|uniref:YkvA family protein n=1 Tax=Syntrophomonas palmitatica TaxID=402877 RepID=UPI0006D06928|nr:DUF1232 domain-containing protein [Syntrophomonas palmitatica]
MSDGEKKLATQTLKQVLLFIPNLVKLMYRLVQDENVTTTDKALLLGTIAYVVSPLDFLPDIIPFLGKVDDILLVSLVLKRLMDSVDREVLVSYWDGDEDLLNLIDKTLKYAVLLVPKGIYEKLVKKSQTENYTDVQFKVKEDEAENTV